MRVALCAQRGLLIVGCVPKLLATAVDADPSEPCACVRDDTAVRL